MTKKITAKMGITLLSFKKWGSEGGKKSLQRFKGKSKKEISDIMKKVSMARIKKSEGA